MKISFSEKTSAEVQIFLVSEKSSLPAAAEALNGQQDGLLAEALKTGSFAGKVGQVASVVLPAGSGIRRAVLVGRGNGEADDRTLERIGGELYKAMAHAGFSAIDVCDVTDTEAVRIALGVKLAAYRFDTYRTQLKEDQKPTLDTVTLIVSDGQEARTAFGPLEAAADGTYLARDLVNLAPNDLYPESYARRLEALSEHGVEVEILGEAALEQLGMNAMLGVGQGSVRESQLGIMKWMGGDPDEDPVVLVGKGVCSTREVSP